MEHNLPPKFIAKFVEPGDFTREGEFIVTPAGLQLTRYRYAQTFGLGHTVNPTWLTSDVDPVFNHVLVDDSPRGPFGLQGQTRKLVFNEPEPVSKVHRQVAYCVIWEVRPLAEGTEENGTVGLGEPPGEEGPPGIPWSKSEIMELVRLHAESTGFCSMMGHMRSVSTAYARIMAIGAEAVPAILEFLKTHPGMSVQLLLMDIVGEPPLRPAVEHGFVKTDVRASAEAWLAWGREKGLIE